METASKPAISASSDTPASSQFRTWLNAFNSADRAVLVAYHQRYFPFTVASADVADIERELRLSQGTGGFTLKQAESSGPTRTVVILKEQRSTQFARAEMEVEAGEPHRVTRFEIQPIPTPDSFLSPEERTALQLDAVRRRLLIDRLASALEAHYVFPEVAKRMVAEIRDRLARGEYDAIQRSDAFAKRLTHDLREVSRDLHLAVIFRLASQAGPRPPPRAPELGLGPIERLSGNIAYLVIQSFPPVDTDAKREDLARSMSQVADADAMVVDLRTNTGGDPNTVALVASYMFDEIPVHLNDMFRRDVGSTSEFWTSRDVRGKRFGASKPLYVLTSSLTISGGEELAYDLQSLRRARLVGETTAGAAHPAEPHHLDEWFDVLVPWGRPINPITRTNWEGVGVVPDISVQADLALEEAHRRALEDLRR